MAFSLQYPSFKVPSSEFNSSLAFLALVPNNVFVLTRDNPRLTLAGARAILAAAEKKATEIKVPMNIAVMDEGGHLLVFARMDGVKLSSIEVAMTKARSAALRRLPTGRDADLALSLGLPMATGLKLTPVRGGLPLVADRRPVGGIGVSGGSEDEDVAVAQAGADALAKFA